MPDLTTALETLRDRGTLPEEVERLFKFCAEHGIVLTDDYYAALNALARMVVESQPVRCGECEDRASCRVVVYLDADYELGAYPPEDLVDFGCSLGKRKEADDGH